MPSHLAGLRNQSGRCFRGSRERPSDPPVFSGVWDFFGRLFARRATFLAPAPVPLPAPAASIGRNASPAALAHLMELFPEHPTIGVVDENRALIAVLEVARAKPRLAAATCVADLI